MLHIQTNNGLAIFDLGEQAEKWREKIANPRSRLDKLGIKRSDAVALLGKFPPDFMSELRRYGVEPANKLTKDSSWTLLAIESPKDLARVRTIRESLRGANALWIVYPKGQTSVTENDVRSAGLAAGLTDVKVMSFSPTHTALKFVLPKSNR